MHPQQFFSATYSEARQAFLHACHASGARVEQYLHPRKGRDGEILATDVARLGADNAERVVMTMSATHGVEGFCGSGVQTGALASGLYDDRGDDVAVVLIHAINPFGFSWLCRVTEGNVDLNRNHVNHDQPYVANGGYEVLKDALCPEVWTTESRAASLEAMERYRQRLGEIALQGAISAGQYSHPQGLFYGGSAPTWSAMTLASVVRRHAANARHVAFLDYHTGLGPFGVGELISDHETDEPGHRRLVEWFGEGAVTSTSDGSSVSAPLTGTNSLAVALACGHASLTMATLEYGTSPLDEVLDALMADCWLHNHGDLESATGRAIKAEIRRCFYPDTDPWKEMVFRRATAVETIMLDRVATQQ